MGKIRVKVLESRLLIDTSTIDENGEYLRLDYPKPGSIHEVPDNPFWRRKCFEKYLEFRGEIEDKTDPWKKMTVSQLQALAREKEVDLQGATKKNDIVAALEAAGIGAPAEEE